MQRGEASARRCASRRARSKQAGAPGQAATASRGSRGSRISSSARAASRKAAGGGARGQGSTRIARHGVSRSAAPPCRFAQARQSARRSAALMRPNGSADADEAPPPECVRRRSNRGARERPRRRRASSQAGGCANGATPSREPRRASVRGAISLCKKRCASARRRRRRAVAGERGRARFRRAAEAHDEARLGATAREHQVRLDAERKAPRVKTRAEFALASAHSARFGESSRFPGARDKGGRQQARQGRDPRTAKRRRCAPPPLPASSSSRPASASRAAQRRQVASLTPRSCRLRASDRSISPLP